MSMAVGGGTGGPKADINMTPMIDVLLVLIIIFMVITPLTPKGLEALILAAAVELAKTDSATTARAVLWTQHLRSRSTDG